MEVERSVRIQQIKARVRVSAYAVDPDAVAAAIIERLIARAHALAAGQAALAAPPTLLTPPGVPSPSVFEPG
jgi:hypothetical protein